MEGKQVVPSKDLFIILEKNTFVEIHLRLVLLCIIGLLVLPEN